MWCPACRADVAAELSPDSRRFQCARCSTELGTAAGAAGPSLPVPTTPTDAERNARELLARWNAQNVIEPPPAVRTAASPPAKPSVQSSEAAEPASAGIPRATVLGNEELSVPKGKRRRVDRSERQQRRSPESIDSEPSPSATPRSQSWGMTIGQVCAHFGIGLTTCGTAVVLWSYFGGPANYGPTGWLVTTIGQMFLFLGVVTLISSGMEQTSSEVAARIDVIGQRLIRIENLQRRHALNGPHRRKTKQERSGIRDDG